MTPRTCQDCGTAIDGRRAHLPNVTRCGPCQYAKRHPARPVAAPSRQCLLCGADIADRHLLARYCFDCAGQLRHQTYEEQARQRRSVKPTLDDVQDAIAEAKAARDFAIEAEIEKHLAEIRARGGYHLTDEVIWSRRVDPVQAVAPEASDWPSEGSHSPDSRERSKMRQRACRARQKGRAA